MFRRALILAAGMGTRLRPLTDLLPKCLVPVRGRPLLEYWIAPLLDAGVEHILINTHYHAEMVEFYLRSSPWADRITLRRETELLGTGGTMIANAGFFAAEPTLVAHADNLSLFDPRAFAAAHADRPAAAVMTMMTFTATSPSLCGIVTTDGNGLVTGFYEKQPNPPGNRANAAIYLVEPAFVQYAASLEKRFVDISTEVLPHFIGRIGTWHNRVYHRDIGTLESWRAAQVDFPALPPVPPDPDPWALALSRFAPRASAAVEALLQGKGA